MIKLLTIFLSIILISSFPVLFVSFAETDVPCYDTEKLELRGSVDDIENIDLKACALDTPIPDYLNGNTLDNGHVICNEIYSNVDFEDLMASTTMNCLVIYCTKCPFHRNHLDGRWKNIGYAHQA